MFVHRVWNNSQWLLAQRVCSGWNYLEQFIGWEMRTGQNPAEDTIGSAHGYTDAQRKCLSASQPRCSALEESMSGLYCYYSHFTERKLRLKEFIWLERKWAQIWGGLSSQFTVFNSQARWLLCNWFHTYSTWPVSTPHTLRMDSYSKRWERDLGMCVLRGGCTPRRSVLRRAVAIVKIKTAINRTSAPWQTLIFACHCHSCHAYKSI